MSTSAPSTNPSYPATPELNKLHAISAKSQAIGEFLEWLQSERHVELCTRHEHTDGCFPDDPDHEDPAKCGCHEDELVPIHKSIETLLAMYFEIDLNKVEGERRAILDRLRDQQKEG